MSGTTGQFQTFGGRRFDGGGTGRVCITGFVNLFRFIQAPRPGDVIGTLTQQDGRTIDLIQTSRGGTPLSSADGRFVTLCGRFVRVGGRTVFDVDLVIISNIPSQQPPPIQNNQLLLLILLLLLLGGGRGLGFGQQSVNLTNILGQLGAGGQNIDLNALISQLQRGSL